MKTTRNFLIAGAAMAALMAGSSIAKCQPYFTNSSPQAGAYQYNQNYAQPLRPSVTLSKQYQAGILTGATNCYASCYNVVYFTTNIYTAPPVVMVTSSATNAIASIIYTTTTNFMFGVNVTNVMTTNYWEAVDTDRLAPGHGAGAPFKTTN